MVRDDLLRLRADAEAEMTTLAASLEALFSASRDSNADDGHAPGGATIGFERAQLPALRPAARDRIAGVDAARPRVGGGTYGVCEGCGRPTPGERLAARPFARRC